MATVMSAVLVAGPWVLVSLALLLAYKVVVVILVRSSKTDVYYRDRWTGLLIQRGEPNPPDTPEIKRKVRNVDTPDPAPDSSAHSG